MSSSAKRAACIVLATLAVPLLVSGALLLWVVESTQGLSGAGAGGDPIEVAEAFARDTLLACVLLATGAMLAGLAIMLVPSRQAGPRTTNDD